MKASARLYVVIGSICLMGAGKGVVQGQTFESHVFSDPNLLAAIFAQPPPPPSTPQPRPFLEDNGSLTKRRGALYATRPIPQDWEQFDREFAPQPHASPRTLDVLENGMYKVNQTVYSIKLAERKVNSMLNFEYSLHELGGYDYRSRQNAIDNFFDHATVKTDFNWDAPIGVYVGIRFQIKCESIFQFWK